MDPDISEFFTLEGGTGPQESQGELERTGSDTGGGSIRDPRSRRVGDGQDDDDEVQNSQSILDAKS